MPKKQLMQLVEACDEILVLEDGQPFVEKQLKGYLGIGIKVKGRLDGTLSQDGELNPDSVARAVGKENKAEFSVPSLVEMQMCIRDRREGEHICHKQNAVRQSFSKPRNRPTAIP